MASGAKYASKPAIQANTTILGNANVNGSGPTYIVARGDMTVSTPTDDKGYRITQVFVKAANATIGGGTLLFYTSPDSGSTLYPVTSVTVPVISPAANVAAWEATVPALEGLVLPGGNGAATATLHVSSWFANTFYVTAVGGYL